MITITWRNFTIDRKFLVSKTVYSIHTWDRSITTSPFILVTRLSFFMLPEIYPQAFMTS